jgi:replication initiation protein RepC
MKADMETYGLTTPFGRRPATLGQIAAQLRVRQAVSEAEKPGSNAPAAVDKWRVSRTLTEIRERLGVSDRALAVLTALLSFHPETALTLPKTCGAGDDGRDGREQGSWPLSCELVVFPSNKALAARAHGMAPKTLWRHLTALVAAGLIIRRDSPNGKRYARKAGEGASERFSDAFGFDLTPLVARAAEFEAIAEELRAEQKRRHLTKERVSLMRRDVTKTIALGLDEGLPGDWEGLRLRAMALMTPLRRIRDDRDLQRLAADLAALREETAKALGNHLNVQNMTSNDGQSATHQSNSKSKGNSDLEPASEEEGARTEAGPLESAIADDREDADPPSYPLGMVMEACQDVNDFAPEGRVRTWSAFIAAVGIIRPMIGISPDAWRHAVEVLGRVEAHVVVATILQRSIHSSEAETIPGLVPGSMMILVNGSPAIQSAGGYLRALTDKARAGEFALGPVLMALIGQRLKAKRARRAA